MVPRGDTLHEEDAMLKRIAVPLDGSALGEYALPYAISAARITGASLTLLHVHRPHLPGRDLEALPQYQFQRIASFDDAADRTAYVQDQDRFGVLAEQLRAAYGLEVHTRVLRGNVVDALTEYARSSGTDLIVMATHGYSGVWKTWLDSTADAVVRHGAVPVLLVRPAPGEAPPPTGSIDFRRMLVPVDGSAFSESIVDFAIELMRKLGLQVTLLRVVPDEVPNSAAHPAAAFQEIAWEDPEAYLDQLASRFPPTVAMPAVQVRHGAPGDAILAELGTGAYDLIAMATHGRGGVRHLLLGSTADQVMRGTTMPILLLRPLASGVGAEANASAAEQRG
jgi:nucleotide-binding universal stress UspA family protein